MLKSLQINQIDASRPRLREVNRAWVETFAAEITDGAQMSPIDVVEQADGRYRLVSGAHRLAAYVQLGRAEIEARILPAESFANENDYLLAEVRENIVRAELTVLDRAASIVAWKQIYEASATLQKRGRKAASELIAETANNSQRPFQERFSLAAARVLDISERSVQVAVNIATKITADVKKRIHDQPIANQQSELQQLAACGPELQAQIVELLLPKDDGGFQAANVTDAIAYIEQQPAPVKLAGWQRFNDGFGRLREAERWAFFDAQEEEITRWQASRKPANRRNAA